MKPRALEDFGVNYRMSGSERNYELCPQGGHGDFKTYVNPETGQWYCFRCGRGGKVQTINSPSSLRKRLFARDRGAVEFPPVELPLGADIHPDRAQRLRTKYNLWEPSQYLLTTGVQYDTVMIPYADKSGEIIYYTQRYRVPAPGCSKYYSMPGPKPLYVPEYVRKWHKPREIWRGGGANGVDWTEYLTDVVLVEGPFDAMSLHDRLRVFAVAMGGKTLAEHQLHQLKEINPARISIMLDREADALNKAIKLKRMLAGKLPKVPVKVVMCPGSDPAASATEALEKVLS